MARTQLAVQMLPRGGAALATVSADLGNGNNFPFPTGEPLAELPEVLCSFFAAAGGTVTVASNQSVDGLTLPSRVLTLPPATVYLWICDGPPHLQSDGSVWLDFSAATSVALYQI